MAAVGRGMLVSGGQWSGLLWVSPSLIPTNTGHTRDTHTDDGWDSYRYHSGNFPAFHNPTGNGVVGDDDDWVLVQWCHGAPGMVPALLLGYKEFQDTVRPSLHRPVVLGGWGGAAGRCWMLLDVAGGD